jgi:hypothetical protein
MCQPACGRAANVVNPLENSSGIHRLMVNKNHNDKMQSMIKNQHTSFSNGIAAAERTLYDKAG